MKKRAEPPKPAVLGKRDPIMPDWLAAKHDRSEIAGLTDRQLRKVKTIHPMVHCVTSELAWIEAIRRGMHREPFFCADYAAMGLVRLTDKWIAAAKESGATEEALALAAEARWLQATLLADREAIWWNSREPKSIMQQIAGPPERLRKSRFTQAASLKAKLAPEKGE